jgi:hypothetical protein
MKFAVVQLFPFSAFLLRPCFATKFSEYILAPNYRSVTPPALLTVNGNVKNPDALCTDVHNSEGAVFTGSSSITLDFGKNIGGTVDFDVRSVSGSD